MSRSQQVAALLVVLTVVCAGLSWRAAPHRVAKELAELAGLTGAPLDGTVESWLRPATVRRLQFVYLGVCVGSISSMLVLALARPGGSSTALVWVCVASGACAGAGLGSWRSADSLTPYDRHRVARSTARSTADFCRPTFRRALHAAMALIPVSCFVGVWTVSRGATSEGWFVLATAAAGLLLPLAALGAVGRMVSAPMPSRDENDLRWRRAALRRTVEGMLRPAIVVALAPTAASVAVGFPDGTHDSPILAPIAVGLGLTLLMILLATLAEGREGHRTGTAVSQASRR